jgi:hypothetical protein
MQSCMMTPAGSSLLPFILLGWTQKTNICHTNSLYLNCISQSQHLQVQKFIWTLATISNNKLLRKIKIKQPKTLSEESSHRMISISWELSRYQNLITKVSQVLKKSSLFTSQCSNQNSKQISLRSRGLLSSIVNKITRRLQKIKAKNREIIIIYLTLRRVIVNYTQLQKKKRICIWGVIPWMKSCMKTKSSLSRLRAHLRRRRGLSSIMGLLLTISELIPYQGRPPMAITTNASWWRRNSQWIVTTVWRVWPRRRETWRSNSSSSREQTEFSLTSPQIRAMVHPVRQWLNRNRSAHVRNQDASRCTASASLRARYAEWNAPALTAVTWKAKRRLFSKPGRRSWLEIHKLLSQKLLNRLKTGRYCIELAAGARSLAARKTTASATNLE